MTMRVTTAMSKPDYEKRVAKVIADGWKKDLSEAVSLERAGLLLTDRMRVELAATAISGVASLLDDTAVRSIVPLGSSLSALDVKRHIAIWLQEIADRNLQQFKES
jgi:hypothetical protein